MNAAAVLAQTAMSVADREELGVWSRAGRGLRPENRRN